MVFKDNFLTHILMIYVFLASGLLTNLLQLLCLPLWYAGYKNLYRKIIIRLNYMCWCCKYCIVVFLTFADFLINPLHSKNLLWSV